MDMTVHTLKYIHKRRGFCKAEKSRTRKKTRTRASVRQLRVAKDYIIYCK